MYLDCLSRLIDFNVFFFLKFFDVFLDPDILFIILDFEYFNTKSKS